MISSSSYLKYLPAICQCGNSIINDTDDGDAFVGDYLKIFEKILTGIDDSQLNGRKGVQQLLSAEVIGNLFYPRFSFLFDNNSRDFIPPISGLDGQKKTAILEKFNRYIGVQTVDDPLAGFVVGQNQSLGWQVQFEAWLNDLVCWLGSWVDLVLNDSWTLDKKRAVVAQIIALYRLRGTAFGLLSMLNLLLDLPLTLKGLKFDKEGVSQPVTGELTIDVSMPQTPAITVQATPAKAFILQDRYSAGMPVVSGYAPFLFCIDVILPMAQNPGFIMSTSGVNKVLFLVEQIRQLTEQLKPANSKFTVSVQPTMQLTERGNATNLGINTLLGIKGK